MQRKVNPYTWSIETQISIIITENSMEFLVKSKKYLPYDTAILLLNIEARELKSH